jgi:hypothetical protein
MKKVITLVFVICVGLLFYQFYPNQSSSKVIISSVFKLSPVLINVEGLTIKERVLVPEGYKRVVYPEGSFQWYLRNYALKPFGSKIINYDDSEYYWQQGHIGVLDIPVPKNGLQQCADALIRVRSEHLWDNNRKDEIGFNFTSGHYCSWKAYADGFRPKIKDNKVSFHKIATSNHTKANFYKYLNLIYMYSGTLSLYNELPKVTSNKNIKLGDLLILGGSPGHIVMVCDEVENAKGEKKYLLFQGNTPAQSVHLVKNLEDDLNSPWYDLKIDATIPVSNFIFSKAKFARFK